MKDRILIVIPARIASTRFPRKVLENLGGFPVVEWCRRAALDSRCGPVAVAADHRDVRDAVEARGGLAVMTPASCRSGTDRVQAALPSIERKLGRRFDVIVNLQGDEPFMPPATIRKVAALLKRGGRAGKRPATDISTAVFPMKDSKAAKDPNRVKAVLAEDGRCLYFSRSAVPYGRDRAPALFQHIGIYGYTREALKRFVAAESSPLEKTESLEQLRALEKGLTVRAAIVRSGSLSIDTPSDLRKAAKRLGGRGNPARSA